MKLYKKPVMEIMELEEVDVLTVSCTCVDCFDKRQQEGSELEQTCTCHCGM